MARGDRGGRAARWGRDRERWGCVTEGWGCQRGWKDEGWGGGRGDAHTHTHTHFPPPGAELCSTGSALPSCPVPEMVKKCLEPGRSVQGPRGEAAAAPGQLPPAPHPCPGYLRPPPPPTPMHTHTPPELGFSIASLAAVLGTCTPCPHPCPPLCPPPPELAEVPWQGSNPAWHRAGAGGILQVLGLGCWLLGLSVQLHFVVPTAGCRERWTGAGEVTAGSDRTRNSFVRKGVSWFCLELLRKTCPFLARQLLCELPSLPV